MVIISIRYIYEEYVNKEFKTFILFDIPSTYQEILFYIFLTNSLLIFPMLGYWLVRKKKWREAVVIILASILYTLVTYFAFRDY